MKKIFWALLIAISVAACDNPDTGEEIDIQKHSLLVYMIGDNSLSSYCEKNIIAIQNGMAALNNDNCVYVYYDNTSSEPKLLKYYKAKGEVVSAVVKAYTDVNSASVARMREVIDDAFATDTADNYGLILWSHASGWFPPGIIDNSIVIESAPAKQENIGIATQSFGLDNNDEMTIQELQQALPDNFFEYIIFDACSMGQIEVAYQLRNKAQYILAATSELPAAGLPYEKMIPQLLSYSRNLPQVTSICFEHITKTLKKGVAIGLINTAGLDDLATTTRNIYAAHSAETPDISNVQHFDKSMIYTYYLTYDFRDYVKTIATASELENFDNQLKNAVHYAKSTADVYGVTIKNYCGASTYIYNASRADTVDISYKNIDWYNAVFN